MAKPDWLVEQEKKKNRKPPKTCGECFFLGEPDGYIRTRDGRRVMYRCQVHPGLLNAATSYICGDFKHI